MIGEIEKCIDELREFYTRSTIMGLAYAISQVNKVLRDLDTDGYGNVQVMKNFKEELAESPA